MSPRELQEKIARGVANLIAEAVLDERTRCAKIADGISVAAGRLRRGYSNLYPGIEEYAISFEREAERIRSGR